ncbi:hypothetical protein LCER1_G007307 [Lachnellula cervina]|uniref:Uncharacterized protein n=1 Tax=Lachnellula cervina TaxID=1316786 RepID=A0A7D8YNH2_9HELO|nr:hypothetical protein LCER1_G007307 [Lachnellula cervina]
MASSAPVSSSMFMRLVSTWRLLALRSDVDSIILELLGVFSLEKIYSEGDKDTYRQLLVTLLAQLNSIFYIQRLSLPSENLQVGWYLGFIVSWEVTLRSIEYVLQTVIEGRESLWEAQLLRDKYLAEFLLSALRVLTLHPKTPANQRAKDRRDRFARIHTSMEQVFNTYPGNKSFLLKSAKDTTDALRSDPESLGLPSGLKYEMPNLASELYPLAECFSSARISALAPPGGFGSWLSQFLALRDVSHFVVGASVQYVVNREIRDMHLQASSSRARNAILHTLDNIQLPAYLSKVDLIAEFSETFRIILPGTPSLQRRSSGSQIDESEMDAIDAFCSRLSERQIVHRVSDREVMHSMSEVTRNIALLDDSSEQFRNIWGLLKPFEATADTINVERHLATHYFQLAPPKVEAGVIHSSYSNVLSAGQPEFSSHRESPDRSHSISQSLVSPLSPGYRHVPDALALAPQMNSVDLLNTKETIIQSEAPFSPDLVGSPGPSQTRFEQPASVLSFDPVPIVRSRTVPVIAPPEKGKPKWRSPFGSRKECVGTSGDTSSLSSSTLESQRLDEISLKPLAGVPKKNAKGKGVKSINVYLSQNSTYALFWNPFSIYIFDVGPSPPTIGRAISTESACVLVAVTKVHLAYVIGTRDQKLTLRIVNLIQPSTPAIDYRMASSPWCRSIAICPKENYVVIGFDNSLVRLYSTTNSEPPREDRLHSRYHPECKECPPVDTLSFSNDGLNLLGTTRSHKTGIIQVYLWKFPFSSFDEVSSCRYQVPLHESEDGGVSSAIFRSGSGDDEDLVCITTWTQSGVPILVQPQDGHRTDIRSEISLRQNKLGSRIQCAAFSPTGTDLALVNDKGDLYQISSLNSSPMNIKKLATSKELTAKSESFAMTFMTLPDEEAIVMAWADFAKGMGYIKKLPTASSSGMGSMISPPTPGITRAIPETPHFELHAESKQPPQPPAELVSPDTPSLFKV